MSHICSCSSRGRTGPLGGNEAISSRPLLMQESPLLMQERLKWPDLTQRFRAASFWGSELAVNRLGFGAMRVTGRGIWGPPQDRDEALRTLRRAPELGINFIDTADSYGPDVSEPLIREALAT